MPCVAVEGLTSYPSILGGRVKTLHPSVFGGILGRRDHPADVEEMSRYHIPEIDLVIVDLYPFEETVASTTDDKAIIEKIDRMVDQIVQATNGELIIAMTGDHSTPVTVGDHTGEPCPIFFWGRGVRPDACTAFGERPVIGGGVGRIRGLDVVNIMTSYMGVQEKFGA